MGLCTTFRDNQYRLLPIRQCPQLAIFHDLYERYAPSFYGEIKRSLYEENICNQTLTDAYTQIWKRFPDYDSEKGSIFIFCFGIVRKEIQKQKINLVLKELFACQTYPVAI